MKILKRGRHDQRFSTATRFSWHRSRRGTTTVEASITLILLLTLLFSMLDLGLLAFQSNMLSLAARQVTREASVRGSAIDPSYAWGPTTCAGNANDGSAIAQLISPYFVTCTKSSVTFQMTWPSGSNRLDNQVTTRLSYQRQALTPLTSWMGTINLQANCTMNIIH